MLQPKQIQVVITMLFLSLLMALFVMPAFSQEKVLKSANKNFDELQYQSAIKDYLKVWNKLKDEATEKDLVAYQLGESYRLTGNSTQSAYWYSQVVETQFATQKPLVYLFYADALREGNKYDTAMVFYNKYLEIKPGDPLALAGYLSCENLTWLRNPSRNTVENVTNINSTEDDYSPTFSSKNHSEIFFSSNREGSIGKEIDDWTGAWFSDIYMAKHDKGNWLTPVSADETNTVNTNANEGTPTFDRKLQKLYFTRCKKSTEEKIYCQILKSGRHGKKWTKTEVVLSDANSNIGQPFVSDDGHTIYFASNRTGGYGGKDIWKVSRERKGKPFSEPVNLGRGINTAGDELFPYLVGDSIIYFASDGHPGLGGLDLFKSTVFEGQWTIPENLHPPVNSSDDDFAIIFKSAKEGYFSSNRPGGLGGDDIYHFTQKNIYYNLSGVVKNEITQLSLKDVIVSLIDDKNDTTTTQTNEQGYYDFDSTNFNEDKNYRLLISKENYFAVSYEINTNYYQDDYNFFIDFLLTPILEEPIVLPDILYDLDKWDLKPQYQDSLMLLVRILNDNPDLNIELGSHTDSRASAEYNDDLSQKRAQEVVDFLISKNIDPDRLRAKGYGERVPRTLIKDYATYGNKFKKGVVLSEQFIDQLDTDEMKNFAHKLNRRTEFKVFSLNENDEPDKPNINK